MTYDIVVPLLKTDLPTLLKNIPYLKKNLHGRRIVIIGKQDLYNEIKDDPYLVFVNEDKLVKGLSFEKIKHIKTAISGNGGRAGWYFQQFLKMAYANVCQDDYYLIWDADTIPIKPLSFFDENGVPFMDYRDYESKDECYNETQMNLLPNQILQKKEHKSFIAEHMLINVNIMRELILRLTCENRKGKSSFYENIMYSIPLSMINLSGFSEFECYAAYALNLHKGAYKLRYWKNLRNARTYIGVITEEKAAWISECFDVISIEDFDNQWLICKLLCQFRKSIRFSKIYRIINPLYNIYFDIRFAIRTLIKR